MSWNQNLEQFLVEKNYISPWSNLDNTRNALFTGNGTVLSVKKGAFLFRQGECCHTVYIVRTGRMRISFVDNTGTEVCLYIVETGGMLGEDAAVDGLPSSVSAVAITDCTVYQLNIKDFIRIINLRPETSLEVMCNLSYKVRRMCSAVEFTTKSSKVRVAASLLALCVRYGQEQPNGIRITIRFTHEELANLNNLNRVTVTKLMRSFMRENAISGDSGGLVVHQLSVLKDYLNESPKLL